MTQCGNLMRRNISCVFASPERRRIGEADFAWGDGKWHPYINMPGLYVYNGKFAGILMRMACGENIIVAHENERTAPVFEVRGLR